ncbi:hypothetical protein ACFLQ8_00900 [Candidatus Auribacterota bacterium]
MSETLRKKDFMIGKLHGKLQASDRSSEAHMQRLIFLSQKVRFIVKRDLYTDIRIFAYEMPLRSGVSRGESVDIVGYDKDHNLYLIELKKKGSTERIEKIIDQLNGYEKMVRKILPYIEKEFKAEYFVPIKFIRIKKIILAPREFFLSRKKELVESDIAYCYFRDVDVNMHIPGKIVNIHQVKR